MQRPNRERMRPRIPSEKPVGGGIFKIHHSESGSLKIEAVCPGMLSHSLSKAGFSSRTRCLPGIPPAASCAGLIGHPSVARIFHREKFARARPLKFEGGAARTRMSSGAGSDEHWCGRRDSNPHNFRHWNLNPARLPIPPRPPIATCLTAVPDHDAEKCEAVF